MINRFTTKVDTITWVNLITIHNVHECTTDKEVWPYLITQTYFTSVYKNSRSCEVVPHTPWTVDTVNVVNLKYGISTITVNKVHSIRQFLCTFS